MRSNLIVPNPEYLMGRPLALSKFVASCRPLINQNQPKYTRINPNQPVSTPSDQNQPELIQNNPNQPESTHMNLNQPKSTRINPNQPESTPIIVYQIVPICINPYQLRIISVVHLTPLPPNRLYIHSPQNQRYIFLKSPGLFSPTFFRSRDNGNLKRN